MKRNTCQGSGLGMVMVICGPWRLFMGALSLKLLCKQIVCQNELSRKIYVAGLETVSWYSFYINNNSTGCTLSKGSAKNLLFFLFYP